MMWISYCVLTGFLHLSAPLFYTFSHFLAPTKPHLSALSAQTGDPWAHSGAFLPNSETGDNLSSDLPNLEC